MWYKIEFKESRIQGINQPKILTLFNFRYIKIMLLVLLFVKNIWGAIYFSSNSFWSSTESENTKSVDLGYFDGDSYLDLAVGNALGKIRVHKGDGKSFNLTSDWESPANESAGWVLWGNVSGDNRQDLVLGNYGGVAKVFENQSGINFISNWASSVSHSAYRVDLGDWNNDGDLDLAVSEEAGPVRIYTNKGSGLGFNSTPSWNNGADILGGNSYVLWVDVNNDNYLDLIVTDYGAGNIIYTNDGNNNLNFSWRSLEVPNTYCVSSGDIEGDSDIDLIFGNENQDMIIYTNNGNGKFGATPYLDGIDSTDTSWDILLFDIDSDGDLDIIAPKYGQKDKIYTNNGQNPPSFAKAWESTLAENSRSVTVGDIDNDGDYDIVFGVEGGPNRMYRNERITAPTNFKLSSSTESIILSWAKKFESNLAGYKIYYGFISGATNGTGAKEGNSPIIVTNSVLTNFLLSGLIPNTNYFVKIKAFSTNIPVVISGFSKQTNTTPKRLSAPTNVIAASQVESIYIRWDKATDEVSGYKIYYATNLGGTNGTGFYQGNSPIIITNANLTNFLFTGGVIGRQYYISLKVFNTNLIFNSLFSSEVNATPLAINPPSGLKVLSAKDGAVELVWDSYTSPILSYKLYYAEKSGPVYNGTGINEGDSPILIQYPASSIKLTGLSDYHNYYFALTVVSLSSNESVYSSEVSAMPLGYYSEKIILINNVIRGNETAPVKIYFEGKGMVSIYSESGKLFKKIQNIKNEYFWYPQNEDFSSGIYYIKVETENAVKIFTVSILK